MLQQETISRVSYVPPATETELQQEINAILRTDLAAFIEKVFHTVSPGEPFLHNWHIDCIAEHLMALERRDFRKLIINIPPRALKSISCNVAWPAWLLGQDPSNRMLSASYAQSLSDKHSTDCRLVIESNWYRSVFPGTKLSADNNQKRKYVTTARGHRIATSVGGVATGEGGNILILDDPHSAADAQSDVIRKGQVDWINTSWASRLNDKINGLQLLIMQRLHQSDATGALMEQGWEHLVLPAEFERKTIIQVGHYKRIVEQGELLQPKRESKEILANLRAQMGSYAFAGQYQQRPAPAGGGIFKRDSIRAYPANRPLPRFEYIIQSYDTAFTESTQNDPTAFTAWGIFSIGDSDDKSERKYGALLMDAWQLRMEYPELRKKAMLEYKTRYGEGDGKCADVILIEAKGSGLSLVSDLQRSGLPVYSYNPGRADKVQRAHLITPILEAGLVYFPESDKFKGKFYGWAEEVLEQMLLFPNADHDDLVDSFTQAIRLLKDQSWLKIKGMPKEDEPEPTQRVNPYVQ